MNSFTYSDNWHGGMVDDLTFVVPKGISTKVELFAAYKKDVLFPHYFGENWDAFDECIRDLSWVRQQRLIALHRDVPLDPSPKDQKTYLEILGDAVAGQPTTPQLVVLFPTGARPKIEALLAT